MLSTAEKILFTLATLVSLYFTYRGVMRIVGHIASGQGKVNWSLVWKRLGELIAKVGLFQPVFRFRLVPSIFHALIGWGFLSFLLINLADVIYAFTNFKLLEHLGLFGDAYRLLADIANVAILVGIVAMVIRRFILRPSSLSTRSTTLLHPKARFGILRDSAIVATFIFVHNSMRLLGESFGVALAGHADRWQPTISMVAGLWSGIDAKYLIAGEHVAFWMSIGAVVAFLPYFPYSKHIHLFFAPLNFALKPERKSIGQLRADGQGAATMKDLGWEQIMDSYACIMCFRCQEVCPAYNSGKLLSPAALEINKRYHLNDGGGTDIELKNFISAEAAWACTSCGACVDICPVGNEPMEDIVDIRRRLIIDRGIDSGVQNALQSLATNGNAMSKGKRLRGRWAKEMEFPVKNVLEEPVENLWFVGDTASFDERVIPNTKLVAQVFNQAGLDFGIMYQNESNAGNDVRRVGEEGLFEQLAEQNMQAFGKAQFKQIVTTDPHSFNTLKNEYPQFGSAWEVKHYTAVLVRLFEEGKLTVKNPLSGYKVTYHDPCYLGRYNGGFSAPRKLLELVGVEFNEMPRNCEKSFCCGAGGGQIWMGKDSTDERPAENRIKEALTTFEKNPSAKKQLFIVTCPKDVIMYSDAVKTTGNENRIEVRDLIQLVAEAVGLEVPLEAETIQN